MSKAVERFKETQEFAMSIRPKVGGFPYLAEAFRRAGVMRNIWNLPACQNIYLTAFGPVVAQSTPLFNTMVDIPRFNQDALIKALKIDQEGNSTFPEFLKSAWEAGVVSYVVNFEKRLVSYYGIYGESYTESYPAVEIGAVQ